MHNVRQITTYITHTKCQNFEKESTVNNLFSMENENHSERIAPIERSRLGLYANIVESVRKCLYAETNVLTVNLNVKNVIYKNIAYHF